MAVTHNQSLDVLASFVEARERADMQIEAAVVQARRTGASWASIARQLKCGEDTARNRYRRISG